jgi:hypothetical protein
MEQLKIYTLLLTFIISLSYVIRVWVVYGIQPTISQSYYKFKYPDRCIFQIMIYVLSICIIVNGYNLWFLISGLLLSLVGFFPTIKNKVHKVFHFIGALGGIALTFVSFIYVYHYYIPAIIVVVSSAVLFLIKIKNIVWWIEIICVLVILSVFSINIIC